MARKRSTYSFTVNQGETDQREVTVNLIALGARDAAIMAQRIAGLVAPVIGAMQSGDLTGAGKALSALPPGESWDLLVKFCEGATVEYTKDDGQKVVAAADSKSLDIALTGASLETFRILMAAVTLNYPEFFRKLT